MQISEPKCNFLENLSTDCVQLFRKVVIDMVSGGREGGGREGGRGRV